MSGDERIGYLLKLARAMHGYGYAANRLEEVLTVTSNRLGLEAQFFTTPTSIFAAFGVLDEQRTFLLRVEPGDTDLGRLADVDRITLRVARGTMSVREGSLELDAIGSATPLYGSGLTIFAFGVSSAATARFLGGGMREILFACALGFITGFLAIATARRATLARIFEPLAALVVTFIATAYATLVAPLAVSTTVLAGLIVLIPGFTLTTAMTELAMRHLASGTARLAGALLLFVTIVFGVAIGGALAQRSFGSAPFVVPTPLPTWTELLALAIAPLGFLILLRAHLADAGWIVLVGWLAYGATRAGATLLGPELGAFTGALAVGVCANLYALLRDRPSQIVLAPGVLLLVPGSVGFRSVSAMFERQVLSGVETAFNMFFIATAIVAGLLVANIIVPRRSTEGR